MLKRLIEVPINAENITTPTIFPSAIDDTILLGKSALIVSDKETASLISAVLFPASNPWPRLNNSANTIPVIAAKTVKPINDPIVFVDGYYRASDIPEIEKHDLEKESMFYILEKYYNIKVVKYYKILNKIYILVKK